MATELIGRFLEARMPLTDLYAALGTAGDPTMIQFALRIGNPVPVHRSLEIPAQSFEDSCARAHRYIESIVTNHVVDGWVHELEVKKIANGLPRPAPSMPLYFLTAEEKASKAIVYVGKTSAKTGRFDCGHAAITKLHAPEFEGKKKFVYMCAVLVRVDIDDWIPIEFHAKGQELLTQLGSQLIVQLDPCLNADATKDEDAPRFDIVHDDRFKLDKMTGHRFEVTGLQDMPMHVE